MIPFTIDSITPCLKHVATGDIVETEVIRIQRKSFLSKFNKSNGWYVTGISSMKKLQYMPWF